MNDQQKESRTDMTEIGTDGRTLGFVDYPTGPGYVARGDLVCHEGEWRRVAGHVGTPEQPSGLLLEGEVTTEKYGFPCARIAAPVLDALRRSGEHPYR